MDGQGKSSSPSMLSGAQHFNVNGSQFNNVGNDMLHHTITILNNLGNVTAGTAPNVENNNEDGTNETLGHQIPQTDFRGPRSRLLDMFRSRQSCTAVVDLVQNTANSLVRPPCAAAVPRYTEMYLRLMLGHGHGYPLYDPNPAIECQTTGVQIGDVGRITPHGAFDYLFNVRSLYGNSIGQNAAQVSSYFQPGQDVISKHVHVVAASPITYNCSGSEGVVLQLPEGAVRFEAKNLRSFRELAACKAFDWYKYMILDQGWDAPNGSLILVTECIKTKAWGIGVFYEKPVEGNYLKFVSEGQVPMIAHRWVRLGPIITKISPNQTGSNEAPTQCLFVRGYKIMLGEKLWKELEKSAASLSPTSFSQHPASSRGNSGSRTEFSSGNLGDTSYPSQRTHMLVDTAEHPTAGATIDSGQTMGDFVNEPILLQCPNILPAPCPSHLGTESRQVTLESFCGTTSLLHPSDPVNVTLLRQNPTANVAITHDSEWCHSLPNNFADDPSNLKVDQLLENVFKSHKTTVDQFGCVSLAKIPPEPAVEPSESVPPRIWHDQENVNNPENTKPKLPVGACNRCKLLKVKCNFENGLEACNRCHNGGHDCVITAPKLPVGACNRCKLLKVKCNFENGLEACNRCHNGGHYCAITARKKRRCARHHDLLDQIREQANDIGRLMSTLEAENTVALQRASTPGLLPPPSPTSTTTTLAVSEATGPKFLGRANSAILEWIAKAKESWNAFDDHITNTGATISSSPLGHDSIDLASPSDPDDVPDVISRRVVDSLEAELLFSIYFANINPSVLILDPVLYTAKETFFRSPFLFTVICAVSSRFYTKRPGLYSEAMHCAQSAAAKALTSGRVDLDMCHAYMLLGMYPEPARKWEETRSGLYLGLAARVAMDLKLYIIEPEIPCQERPAREALNRARAWLTCFNLDQSTSGHYGKPPAIGNLNYQADHWQGWWKNSQYNMRNLDIYLCCDNSVWRTIATFFATIRSDPESPTGLDKNANFDTLASEMDDELQRLQKNWMIAIKENTDQNDNMNKFRIALFKMVYGYGRLLVLSYGFHNFRGRNTARKHLLLMKCIKAAEDVLQIVVEDVIGDSSLRFFWGHGTEAQCAFVAFASAFLIRFTYQEPAFGLSDERCADIRNKIQAVAGILSSIAIDTNHWPKLYSEFLEGLLQSQTARRSRSSDVSMTSHSASELALALDYNTPQVRHSFPSVGQSYQKGTEAKLRNVQEFDMADLGGSSCHMNIDDSRTWDSLNWPQHDIADQQNLSITWDLQQQDLEVSETDTERYE